MRAVAVARASGIVGGAEATRARLVARRVTVGPKVAVAVEVRWAVEAIMVASAVV